MQCVYTLCWENRDQNDVSCNTFYKTRVILGTKRREPDDIDYHNVRIDTLFSK